jgi:hypothetical protein
VSQGQPKGNMDAQLSAGNKRRTVTKKRSAAPAIPEAKDESLTETNPNLATLAYHSALKQLVDYFRKYKDVPRND